MAEVVWHRSPFPEHRRVRWGMARRREARALRWLPALAAGWLAIAGGLATARGGPGGVEITIVDKKTGQPIPCRIHLKDRAGKPQRAGRLPFWHDHFACPGTALLDLAPGDYSYEVERGPEYALRTGSFTVQGGAPGKVRVELERRADLAREGWWSGELHVHRPLDDIEL